MLRSPVYFILGLHILVVIGIFLFVSKNESRFLAKRRKVLEIKVGRLRLSSLSRRSRAEQRRSEAKRTLVVLVTNTRSGSTFVGKLFDANDGVLYIFEPFWPGFDNLGIPWSQEDDRKTGLLRSFLKCQFDSPESLQFLAELASGLRQWTRSFSTALTSDHFCHKGSLDVKSHETKTVCSYESSLMQENCLTKQAVVIKSIRLANITRLKSLFDVGSHYLPADPHVLHLVRDPRGTLHSRMNMRGYFRREYLSAHASLVDVSVTKMLQYSASRLCEQIRYTILVGESNLPWLQGSLVMTSSVLQWIEHNTHDNSFHRTALDTTRNSTSVIDSWKPWLTSVEGRQYVKIIEEQCRDVMRHLGYPLAL